MKLNSKPIYLPIYPAKLSARAAGLLALLAVATGAFLFRAGLLAPVAAQQAQVAVLNAASFNPDRRIAPDSLAAAFGQFVTQNNQNFSAPAGVLPLPTTLGGVQLRINGVSAGLLFVGTQQLNFQVPPALTDAPSATVTVTNSDNSTRTGTVTVQRAAPGLFSAAANGQGVGVALTTFDGVTYQSVFNPGNPPTERDVDAGTPQRRNVLVLFGTGLKLVGKQNIGVTLQGVPLQVDFVGAVGGLAGLDQINAFLPPEAAGLGSVDIQVNATIPSDSALQRSNKTTIRMGGQLPLIRVLPITVNTPVDGELTADDQIQQLNDGTKRTYFFDAYRFTTTQANTTVAIDMRVRGNSTVDPAVLLYRVNNGSLAFFGEDDQSGGYGNGSIVNNNALYFAVLPTPGDYVIFATSANEQPDGLGTYTLRLRDNVITQTSYGSTVNGTIATTDVQTAAGTYLKAYWFSAAANDNVDVRLNATAFDAFLILQANEGGLPIASDDNGGGGTNSRIQRRLGTEGIYVLLATPYEPNRTGAFTLITNRVSSLTEEETPVAGPQRGLHDTRGELRPRMTGRSGARVIEQ
ncbi:MAG: hypothetical protein HYR56_33885 [Acidobacteria bacterium]|nr:hypothetical protein [Acidobacteriota bacterium]MBI3427559.1 hypothetical protein [Acidobacteriota bacterium]